MNTISLSELLNNTYQGDTGFTGSKGEEYVPLYGVGEPPDPTGLDDGTVYFQHEA